MGEREREAEHRISAMSSQHANVMCVLMEWDGRVLFGTGLSSSLRGVKDRKFCGFFFVSLTSAEVTNQSLEDISFILNLSVCVCVCGVGGVFKMTAMLKSFI